MLEDPERRDNRSTTGRGSERSERLTDFLPHLFPFFFVKKACLWSKLRISNRPEEIENLLC